MASPTRGSQTRQRCKDAARHSCSPDAYAANGLNQEAFLLGRVRSTSDTDLLSPDARSTLAISSSRYVIGQSEDLVITWDIKEEVDARDWIGMYLLSKQPSSVFPALPCFDHMFRLWAEPGPSSSRPLVSPQMSCSLGTFWTTRTAASAAPTEDRSSGKSTPAPTSARVRLPAPAPPSCLHDDDLCL